MTDNDTVLVRYIVDDVDAALDFYTGHLGFDVVMHPAPTFALLARGALRVVGTASHYPSRTSNRKSTDCVTPGRGSATTSSPASAASRSCSTTPPATRSSFSKPLVDQPRITVPQGLTLLGQGPLGRASNGIH